MITKAKKAVQSALNCGELEGGQTTVEYIIVIGVVVGLGALLLFFRDQIGEALTSAGEAIAKLFSTITDGAVS